MFDSLNLLSDHFNRIPLHYTDRSLSNDFAAIHNFIYPMNGATGDFHSVVKGLIDCMKTCEAREKAWVQVQYLTLKSIDEGGIENSHEPCQGNQVRVVSVYGFDPCLL